MIARGFARKPRPRAPGGSAISRSQPDAPCFRILYCRGRRFYNRFSSRRSSPAFCERHALQAFGLPADVPSRAATSSFLVRPSGCLAAAHRKDQHHVPLSRSLAFLLYVVRLASRLKTFLLNPDLHESAGIPRKVKELRAAVSSLPGIVDLTAEGRHFTGCPSQQWLVRYRRLSNLWPFGSGLHICASTHMGIGNNKKPRGHPPPPRQVLLVPFLRRTPPTPTTGA